MYRAGFHTEPVTEVPQEMQEQAAGISLELEQDELNEAQSLENNLHSLGTEYQEKLHAIIGGKHRERYYEFRKSIRERVRDIIRNSTSTNAGEHEVEKARHQAIEESQELLKEIGFDIPRATVMREEYHQRYQEIMADAIERPEEPNYLVLPEMVPEEIHNPWKIIRPPFAGSSSSCSSWKTDEPDTPHYTRHVSAAAGRLGSVSIIRVSGADDSDQAEVRCRTGLRFWYFMPAAGMLETWIRMQSLDTPFSGSHYNEWGWSSCVTHQESYAYLRVINPGPGKWRKSTLLKIRRERETDKWAGMVTPVSRYRYAHIYSSSSYPGGKWLLLEIGMDDWNYFWSNDVSILSGMEMRWFISSIHIRAM